MATIVIIGAGLTGLSAAYHLEQKGFYDYVLFDKEPTIGGLCRSISQDGFTFDYTGHLLHSSDAYFKQFIAHLLPDHFFNTIVRRSFIYSNGRYSKYPFQMHLQGLPVEVMVDCISGYAQRKIQRSPVMFKDWVLSQFGAGFGKHFFFPYQRKIFSYPVSKLSADWTSRFVPQTDLTAIIRGALGDLPDEPVGYNSSFLYPKSGGIISWVDALAQRLQNPIYTSCAVNNIDIKAKVISFANGHRQNYDQLITTMPLDQLLGRIQEPSNSFLGAARHQLRCAKVVNFNLGFNRDDISDKHWIYFPEKQFPFYRLGFPHNFSAGSVPDGCSSLYGEFSYLNQSRSWINRTLVHAIEQTHTLFGISKSDVTTQVIIPIEHAYVIYNLWRKKNLGRILQALESNAIYSIGRYGAWKYSSMQEAVLEGKAIADRLITIPAYKDAAHASVLHPFEQQQMGA